MSKLAEAVRFLAEELESAEGALSGAPEAVSPREALESLTCAGRAVIESWDNC